MISFINSQGRNDRNRRPSGKSGFGFLGSMKGRNRKSETPQVESREHSPASLKLAKKVVGPFEHLLTRSEYERIVKETAGNMQIVNVDASTVNTVCTDAENRVRDLFNIELLMVIDTQGCSCEKCKEDEHDDKREDRHEGRDKDKKRHGDREEENFFTSVKVPGFRPLHLCKNSSSLAFTAAINKYVASCITAVEHESDEEKSHHEEHLHHS